MKTVSLTSKISKWLAIFAAIPLAIGGIVQGIDVVQYKFLGKAHNLDEVLMRHFKEDHLLSDEIPKITNIQIEGGGLIRIAAYKDKCVGAKRQESDGMMTKLTVLPHPEYVAKLIELYAKGNGGIAYAAMNEMKGFDFKAHKGDMSYTEGKKRTIIIRIYRDGCELGYELDDYGNSDKWRWIMYKH